MRRLWSAPRTHQLNLAVKDVPDARGRLVDSLQSYKVSNNTQYRAVGLFRRDLGIWSLGNTFKTKVWCSKSQYNSLNLLTQTTDAQGHTTTFAYDANGNLLSLTNALNHATS